MNTLEEVGAPGEVMGSYYLMGTKFLFRMMESFGNSGDD